MSDSCKTKGRVFAFINAENLEEIKSRESRTQVARHVGKYYRNRSKPSQKVRKDEVSRAPSSERPYDNSVSDDIGIVPGNAVALSATEADDQKTGITTAFRRSDRRKHIQVVPENRKVRDMKEMQQVLRFTHKDRYTVAQRSDNISQEPETLPKSQCDDIEEDSFKGKEVLFRRKWACDPIHLLSRSRADPFATYPVDDSCDQISLIVDHGMFPCDC